MFDIPQQGEPLPETKSIKASKPRPQRIKRKADPRLAAAARELRDRWLEQVNARPLLSHGKYDVSRPIQKAALLGLDHQHDIRHIAALPESTAA